MPPKRPEPDQQDLYLIQKTTELRQRFRYSPYFLQFSPPKKGLSRFQQSLVHLKWSSVWLPSFSFSEIEKYSDRLFQQQTQSESVPKLFELLKGKPYPEELLCGPQKSVLTRSSSKTFRPSLTSSLSLFSFLFQQWMVVKLTKSLTHSFTHSWIIWLIFCNSHETEISTTDAENINFEDLEKKEASYKVC